MPEKGRTADLEELKRRVDEIENNHLVHIRQRIGRLEHYYLYRVDMIVSYAGITVGSIFVVCSILTAIWQYAYLGLCLAIISILHLVSIRMRDSKLLKEVSQEYGEHK